jgi:hypothetical protein
MVLEKILVWNKPLYDIPSAVNVFKLVVIERFRLRKEKRKTEEND